MRRVVLALLVLAVSALVGVGIGVGTGSPSYSAGGSNCSAFDGQHLSKGAKQHLNRVAQHVDAVFEGSVKLPKHVNPDKPLQVRVHVVATWKGAVPSPSTVRVTLEEGPCREWMLNNRSPEDYLFLVSLDHATAGFTAPGDAPRVLAHTSALEKVLGTPRAHGGGTGAGTKVTFTRAAGATPHSFKRLAAPGVALVLVGVLGLLVVGRLARRA